MLLQELTNLLESLRLFLVDDGVFAEPRGERESISCSVIECGSSTTINNANEPDLK